MYDYVKRTDWTEQLEWTLKFHSIKYLKPEMRERPDAFFNLLPDIMITAIHSCFTCTTCTWSSTSYLVNTCMFKFWVPIILCKISDTVLHIFVLLCSNFKCQLFYVNWIFLLGKIQMKSMINTCTCTCKWNSF